MKTIPPPCPEPETGPQYWRSLDQLAETPEFRQWLEKEFPAGASEFADPVSRRHFVKIMSASFLFAGLGLTGCRRPVEKILPFSKMPENYAHGSAQFFATAMPNRGSAIPLLVRSNDGRPTKIEGNPEHPLSNGSTDQFAQASILNLYDPDRATRFAHKGVAATREAAIDFLSQAAKQFNASQGDGLCFLMERSSSPSRTRLQTLLSEKLPKARWFVYEPTDFDGHRQAASLVHTDPRSPKSPAGQLRLAPDYRIDQAKVILSLDCDFLGTEEDSHLNIRRFANGRRLKEPTDSMNRLYAVEGLFSLTGANADHRLRIPTGQVLGIAARIAVEVLAHSNVASKAAGLSAALKSLGEGIKVDAKWITECAKDLLANKGKSLVLAGHRQPLAVHVIAHALNAALGNHGKTVILQGAEEAASGNITDLATVLNAGQVNTLVVLGGNPVYNAPADLGWQAAQRKAKTVVRLGFYEDETFAASDWHLPASHYLESWGDGRTMDGTVVPIQPLIEPLFGGLTDLEVLARVGGLPVTSPHEIVRETFKALVAGANFEEAWKKFLHDGFLGASAWPVVAAPFDWGKAAQAVGAAKPAPAPTKDKLEVVFHRDYRVDDGRYNNNGWLQETPDPITKLTWDNAVLISPATATALGLGGVQEPEQGKFNTRMVEVAVGGRTVQGALWVLPGMADNTVALALGYGRGRTGRVGRGAGFDAYQLRTSEAMHFAPGAQLQATADHYLLACAQEHGAMEGRPILREANWQQFHDQPNFVKGMNAEEPPSEKPLYPNPLDLLKQNPNVLHQWGMSIDLTACVGCTSCMLACQSENNIPIVGKEQVTKGREMSWIRLDRYFAGGLNDPQMSFQPMLCQHCEAAPCESVCPVNATVHDEEGLNVMAYNRCVGTRYCSNNCPYKVRRFNYFDYNKRPLDQLYKSPLFSKMDGEWGFARWLKDVDKGTKPEDEWELMKLIRNPDVSVRMRGVMEKCSFCLQRIEQAKIAQKVKAGASGDVEVPDRTIKTACQQACPAEAIVFGNLRDPNSDVSKLKQQQRDYTVLEFLATKPRTTYLARIRNPNPDMPDYHAMPLTVSEYAKKNGNPFEQHGSGHGGGAHKESPAPHAGKGAH